MAGNEAMDGFTDERLRSAIASTSQVQPKGAVIPPAGDNRPFSWDAQALSRDAGRRARTERARVERPGAARPARSGARRGGEGRGPYGAAE